MMARSELNMRPASLKKRLDTAKEKLLKNPSFVQ